MKHKHSPNFIENEREAFEAKNNRAATFFWTVVTVALFLLGFSLTSCQKEAPIELKAPARSMSTVDITIKFFPTTHPLVKGDLYGLKINSSHIMRVTTQFWIEWKDGATTWQLRPFIFGSESTMEWHTMIPIVNGASDLKLIKVEGDTTITYRLKQIL